MIYTVATRMIISGDGDRGVAIVCVPNALRRNVVRHASIRRSESEGNSTITRRSAQLQFPPGNAAEASFKPSAAMI